MRLTEADVAMRDHGVNVVPVAEVSGGQIHEGDTWKRRGHEYTKAPVVITWHHDAHGGAWVSIVGYELYKYESTPGNNVNINRDGRVALLAAGATATNGAGVEKQFSRGMGGRNSTTFTMEIHNSGNGSQAYPEAQIDACFNVSNAINELCGNQPTDLMTHHEYAMTRKTDPATAAAVEGLWKPRSCTSAGTWHHDDIRTEAVRRWSGGTPPPPPPQEDDMAAPAAVIDGDGDGWVFFKGPDASLCMQYAGQDPYSLGGTVTDAISAVATGDYVNVYAYAPDGGMYWWQFFERSLTVDKVLVSPKG